MPLLNAFSKLNTFGGGGGGGGGGGVVGVGVGVGGGGGVGVGGGGLQLTPPLFRRDVKQFKFLPLNQNMHGFMQWEYISAAMIICVQYSPPKDNIAYGSRFVLFCCGLPILFRVTLPALSQLYDYLCASEEIL